MEHVRPNGRFLALENVANFGVRKCVPDPHHDDQAPLNGQSHHGLFDQGGRLRCDRPLIRRAFAPDGGNRATLAERRRRSLAAPALGLALFHRDSEKP